ncbi:MAG: HAMP domain-containing protein [Nitrosomonadales bacterium]|nr:HAMP domain-containing protein [Nitrosomonadales bacterium]
MTNSSLQSRVVFLLWMFSALLLGEIGASFLMHGFEPVMLVFLALGIALSAWGQLQVRRWLAPLSKLNSVIVDVAHGRFNSRVVGIHGQEDEISALCWNVNDMLDQLNTFFREQETSFRANLDGKFYRQTLPGGMHGGFHKGLENQNVLLEGMTEQKMGAMRTHMLTRVQALNTDNLLKNLTSNQHPDQSAGADCGDRGVTRR